MSVHQLRTYSLASPESAARYATEHWSRHLATLPRFGILPLGVWVSRDDPTQVLALVSYGPGVDPATADRAYMGNQAFRDDMAGFPIGDIRDVQATTLDPVAGSPLQ